MEDRVFVLVVLYLLKHEASLTSAKEYKYVNEGDTATLRCSTENVSLTSWYGPSLTIPYFDDLIKNSNLIDALTIHIVKEDGNRYTDYNLVIVNMSAKLDGDYKCQGRQNGSEIHQVYTIVLIENPSVISITYNGSETAERIMADMPIEIACHLQQDITAFNISWYKDGLLVKSGQSNTLSWSFFPTRNDNKKTIACEVYISQLDKPLIKSAILDIKYFRMNFSITNSTEVMEGHSFEMYCSGEGDPSVKLVHIKRVKTSLKVCEGSSCSVLLNGTRHDSGTYTCIVQTSPGIKHKGNISVRVLYPPDVYVDNNDNSLHCKAKGNPNNISFVAWQHYTELGEMIRTFPGSEYLDLNISYKRYEFNGVYRCQAKNGIPDIAGNTVRSGKYHLKMHGIPEILPNTQMIQYQKYHEPFPVIIFVYSVPDITLAELSNAATNAIETINATWLYRNFTIFVFERQIGLQGYEIHFQLKTRRNILSDPSNYTFIIENEIGMLPCTIFLQVKDANIPSPPIIKAISSIGSDVMVSFQQNSNIELLQQFVVEYRKVYENTRTLACTINNTLTEPHSATLYELEYDVEYCDQVYAWNDFGKSNSTEVCAIKTANNQTNQTYMYTLITLLVGVILILCAYFGLRKSKKTTQGWILRLRRNSGSNDVADENEQELQDSPPLDSPPMVHNEMSSIPNRSLVYVDLDLSKNTRQFQIRGEERTNYSDIEYFRVGPPASSSSSENGDEDKDNDDFMSLEEISDRMKGGGADAIS